MHDVAERLANRVQLTTDQHMKRFARLTAAHSKKLENHVHMVAPYTTWYNFARINSAVRISPAMAARLTDRLWHVGDIVNLVVLMRARSKRPDRTKLLIAIEQQRCHYDSSPA